MSLSFPAVVRALDETLPDRFGGDYQLVEDEGANGERRLRLLVHPGIGPVDPRAVAEVFGSVLDRWPASGPLALERHVPLATKVGKVLHIHRTRGGLERPP
jgi:hypothetical protein